MVGICSGSPEKVVEHLVISQSTRIPAHSPPIDAPQAQECTALFCFAPVLWKRERENWSPSPCSFPGIGLELGHCSIRGEKAKERKTVRLDWVSLALWISCQFDKVVITELCTMSKQTSHIVLLPSKLSIVPEKNGRELQETMNR